MGLPLILAHLVRRTCELADHNEDLASAEVRKCFTEFSDPYVDKYLRKFREATTDGARLEALAFLENLRWGKVAVALEPVIADRSLSDEVRTAALTASFVSTLYNKNTAAFTLPLVMDQTKRDEQL